MKAILRNTYQLSTAFGFDPRRTLHALRGVLAYWHDLRALRRQQSLATQQALAAAFPFGRSFPCLGDRYESSGSATGHYFHQDLLVARRVFANNPRRHVDVGSRIDGFVAHVAAFRQIEVIDIRPMTTRIPNTRFLQANFMAPVPEHLVGYCDSLSCLHAIEHFGLGRYGDPIQLDGHLMGLDNLHRVLQPGGTLYFSVPIGPQRIEFNAHRVFDVGYLLRQFATRYRLAQFSYVDDAGELHEDVAMDPRDVDRNFGCQYGCGIFELTKL